MLHKVQTSTFLPLLIGISPKLFHLEVHLRTDMLELLQAFSWRITAITLGVYHDETSEQEFGILMEVLRKMHVQEVTFRMIDVLVNKHFHEIFKLQSKYQILVRCLNHPLDAMFPHEFRLCQLWPY